MAAAMEAAARASRRSLEQGERVLAWAWALALALALVTGKGTQSQPASAGCASVLIPCEVAGAQQAPNFGACIDVEVTMMSPARDKSLG